MGAKYIQFTLSSTDTRVIDDEFWKRHERDRIKGLEKDPEYHREYPLNWAGMNGPVHDRQYEGVYRSIEEAQQAASHRRNDPVALRYLTEGGHKRTLVCGWVSV